MLKLFLYLLLSLLVLFPSGAYLQDCLFSSSQFIHHATYDHALKGQKFNPQRTVDFENHLAHSQLLDTPLIRLGNIKKLPIEEKLETMEIVESTPIEMGATKSFKVTFEDGSAGIFKPHLGHWGENYRAEVLAYQIDRYFGFNLVPPTVARVVDGQVGSLQKFITNTNPGWDGQRMQSQLVAKQTFLDFIIDNGDRHEDNFLVDIIGGIFSIDNGMSFTGRGYNYRPFEVIEYPILDFAESREGRRIVAMLADLDPVAFKKELVEFLGEDDAKRMIKRIAYLLGYLDRIYRLP
ncbi:MAG: hypothetical protein ISR65_05750 [Bacteriovoracaceae bacterium]|nr:hypothetical protein [Bacteriovoracaceae bacterium]